IGPRSNWTSLPTTPRRIRPSFPPRISLASLMSTSMPSPGPAFTNRRKPARLVPARPIRPAPELGSHSHHRPDEDYRHVPQLSDCGHEPQRVLAALGG